MGLIADNPVVVAIVFLGLVIILWEVGRKVYIPFPLLSGVTRSYVERHGVSLAARLRWHNSVGRPIVTVDGGRIVSVWAALDIEARNLDPMAKRLSDLFMVIRKARFPKSVIAVAEPWAIDHDTDWAQRPFPRRVEWELPGASPAITHHVRFVHDFGLGSPDAPQDPRQFAAEIVADLGTPDRRIRLPLGDDILTGRGKE